MGARVETIRRTPTRTTNISNPQTEGTILGGTEMLKKPGITDGNRRSGVS